MQISTIECVHDSYFGGAKQENDFPLGKKYIFVQIYFTVLLLQYGCHDNTLRRFSATIARVIKLFNVSTDSTLCLPSFTNIIHNYVKTTMQKQRTLRGLILFWRSD